MGDSLSHLDNLLLRSDNIVLQVHGTVFQSKETTLKSIVSLNKLNQNCSMDPAFLYLVIESSTKYYARGTA